MIKPASPDNEILATYIGELRIRRIVETRPLLSLRASHMAYLAMRLTMFALISGFLFGILGPWHGIDAMALLGLPLLVLGLASIWYHFATQIHFHSDFVAKGSFVARRIWVFSIAFRYADIGRIDIDLNNPRRELRSKIRVLSRDREGEIEILRHTHSELIPTLLFLSLRVDRTVFSPEAIKLLESKRQNGGS